MVLALVATVFLLGFRLGGESWQSELARVRMEAAHAERQLHNLTRQAFVSMAEAAERRGQQG
jgi:uncharacterized membrane protein YciS (DUF1049 family)